MGYAERGSRAIGEPGSGPDSGFSPATSTGLLLSPDRNGPDQLDPSEPHRISNSVYRFFRGK
jgi:hypothetical protein